MKWLRLMLPVLVLAMGVGVAGVLMATGPDVQREQAPHLPPLVEAVTVVAGPYQVVIPTRGIVAPRTQSTLIPEVAGRIVWISPAFRSGGFFEQGEKLLTIDTLNYETALTIARADLARARLALAQEKAQSEQAFRDWQTLGRVGQASSLVLRRPQLASVQADKAAAEARLRQAEADLKRTRIHAPYAGRILKKQVDVGQYVAPGNVLATLYAVDYVEISLPLTDHQVAFVDLPEYDRGEVPGAVRKMAARVSLTARIGMTDYHWQATLVRTDGSIDAASRQRFVVAQVDDPYAHRGNAPPLKVGQFVKADILGHELQGVFVLPRSTVDAKGRVLIVRPDDHLAWRKVGVVWQAGDRVIVDKGLVDGERISLTAMPYASDGTVVRVRDVAR